MASKHDFKYDISHLHQFFFKYKIILTKFPKIVILITILI
jgi:hypothetical protein